VKTVGFFRASAIVAGKDLRLEWRTMETLSSTLIFALTVMVVFAFAFGASAASQFGVDRVVPGVFWTVLVFSAIVALTRSIQHERIRDTLGALFLSPVDRGALYAGKMAANLVKLTLLQWALLPLTAVFFDFNLVATAGPLLLILFVHGLGLTELGTLFATVSTRLGRGEALLATLLLPAASPLLISAVKCTAAVLSGRPLAEVSQWLLVACGFDLLYFFVALLTFEFVLEE